MLMNGVRGSERAGPVGGQRAEWPYSGSDSTTTANSTTSNHRPQGTWNRVEDSPAQARTSQQPLLCRARPRVGSHNRIHLDH